MEAFTYENDRLTCEGMALADVAKQVGTPVYVYSAAKLRDQFRRYDKSTAGVPHTICYAVKANTNLAVINAFARLGAGADITSGGELYKSLKAGVPAEKIVYSGVGKTEPEIAMALDAGIRMFNVESVAELHALDRIARSKRKRAPIAFRVNPDVDPQTHPKISTGMKKAKFGVAISEVVKYYREAAQMEGVEVVGIDCHIGSQLTTLDPLRDALRRLKPLLETLRESGMNIRYLDFGGGLGVVYSNETPPSVEEYAAMVLEEIKGWNVHLILEPGRNLVANAGALVTEVLYLKEEHKSFIIVDAAMNDLVRPAMYDSYMTIVPVRRGGRPAMIADVVGPICETGDRFAADREIERPEAGDLLAILGAGAYGFAMASTYNGRPLAAEAMVDGGKLHVVRERGTYEDLIQGERLLPA